MRSDTDNEDDKGSGADPKRGEQPDEPPVDGPSSGSAGEPGAGKDLGGSSYDNPDPA